ncbi:MAG: MBL fold metallo-hydrolase [Chloroflexota bacterium]
MIIPIKLKLSNAYLIQERKTILVDTGAPNEAQKILATLQQHRIKPSDISLILHTHGHSDHVGSTAELRRSIAAPTAIHPDDTVMIERGHHGSLQGIGWRGQIMAYFINPRFPAFTPDVLLSDGMRLDDYGVAGKVLHTPGHTPGSVSIVLDDGQALIGDMVMGGYMGGNFLPKRPNIHYFADDPVSNQTSLQNLLAQSPQHLYVGHGGPLESQSVLQMMDQTKQQAFQA